MFYLNLNETFETSCWSHRGFWSDPGVLPVMGCHRIVDWEPSPSPSPGPSPRPSPPRPRSPLLAPRPPAPRTPSTPPGQRSPRMDPSCTRTRSRTRRGTTESGSLESDAALWLVVCRLNSQISPAQAIVVGGNQKHDVPQSVMRVELLTVNMLHTHTHTINFDWCTKVMWHHFSSLFKPPCWKLTATEIMWPRCPAGDLCTISICSFSVLLFKIRVQCFSETLQVVTVSKQVNK